MKKKYITPSVEIYSAILEATLCAGSVNKGSYWGNGSGPEGSDTDGSGNSGITEDDGDQGWGGTL